MPFQYEIRRISRLRELKPGDHIRVPGDKLGKKHFYEHHMLVVCVWSDHELRVIHYCNTQGLTKAEVKEEIIDVSLYEGSIDVLEYKRLPKEAESHSPPDAIARARSRVGETDYFLLSNNCEHFVNWAKIGVARSAQVDRAKSTVAKVGVAAAIGAVAIGAVAIVGSILTRPDPARKNMTRRRSRHEI